MATTIDVFEEEKIYHVFSRSVGNERLFPEERNYQFFLSRYDRFCYHIFETIAYCLLPNHFHLLVRIKSGVDDHQTVKGFSDFLNSYSKAYNHLYSRDGGLFQRKFKRKLIDDESYLTRIILYIHHNPTKHNVVSDFKLWKYSSYQSYLSEKPTKVNRSIALDWFGNVESFIEAHEMIKPDYLQEDLTLE